MVHEISHMFGIRHCIYYNCTMNGTNGPFETERSLSLGTCPICVYKLKSNIKCDSRERYEKLLEASEMLQFKNKSE